MQGVFYRASTQQQASRLEIGGWVKNCPNGKVELIACGATNNLQNFEAWLWQGPQHAQVTNVICENVDSPTEELHSSFYIA